MLTTILLAALAQQPEAATLEAYWLDRLDDLARPDARHGTLGPTGERLWATRIDDAPGLRGAFHYLHHDPDAGDPLAVELLGVDGAPLPVALTAARWAPTHASRTFAVGEPAFAVVQDTWITPADCAVARLRVRGPARFGLRWRSDLATEPADVSRFAPVPVGPFATVDLVRDPRLRRGGARDPAWVEGEAFVSQHGSTGRDRKRAASGGGVLGSEFGARTGHRASWRWLASGAGGWNVRVRYARDAAGPARFRVVVRGEPRGEIAFAPTGGWGTFPAELGWAACPIGAVPEGLAEVELEALHDGANTNVDGVLIAPDDLAEPPPIADLGGLDPLRGAVVVDGGRALVGGVPFSITPRRLAQGVEPGRAVAVAGDGGLVHVLAVPVGAAAAVRCAGATRRVGVRRGGLDGLLVTLPVPADGAHELVGEDAIVIAISRERAAAGPAARRGRVVRHGVATTVLAALHGPDDPAAVEVGAGEEIVLHAVCEWSGRRRPGSAIAAALATADPLAAHRRAYARWFAEQAPRLACDEPALERLWTYRWFLLRHNLAVPAAGFLPGPVFYEGRHGSWYPQVITFSTPHIVAEARWLHDGELALANVRALAASQQADGVLPNLLVDRRSFRYANWIPAATVEALKVHPDRAALDALLPALLRNADGNEASFDRDGDGVLAPGDHYTTGMEFQPSFWAFCDFDNSRPQAELERPDFTSYHYGNLRALAAAQEWLGRAEEAAALAARAERTRGAALRKLWHPEDGFFYSIRESDDRPARAAEVIGFYPFVFDLPPAGGGFERALAALVDEDAFWTPFPVASCSKSVPVFSAAVQRWPGPGGKVTPCMWNGPTWPHAVSLCADAMARALRAYPAAPLRPEQLGELLRRFARFHCEDGDPARPLLREYGDGVTGANWGCADYLHSTFNDLLIRHAIGLEPRFDDALVVRPLALGLGRRWRVDDLPYHGHRVAIEIAGDRLTVAVDGRTQGVGSVRDGLFLGGAVR